MTKEELRQYRSMKKEADDIKKRLDLMELDYGPRSPKVSGMPGGKGTPSDPTGNMATAHAALRDYYEQKLTELEAGQLRIERAISELKNPDQRSILRAYYIDGLKWEEVSVEVAYSWKHMHRIHAAALIALAEK